MHPIVFSFHALRSYIAIIYFLGIAPLSQCVSHAIESARHQQLSGTIKAAGFAAAPVFTKQPEIYTILDQHVLLAAEVTGAQQMWFQWFINGVAIPEATRMVWSVRNFSAGENAVYTLQASNSFGVVVSSNAVLNNTATLDPSVRPLVSIAGVETNTASYMAAEGSSIRFITYVNGIVVWLKDGVYRGPPSFENPGISAIGFSNLSYTNSGRYSLRIITENGVTESAAVELIVPAQIRAYVSQPFGPGSLITNETVSFATTTTIELQSSFPSGLIFYTLDGTVPSYSSELYIGPVTVRANGTLRAIAYTPDLTKSVEMPPIMLSKARALVVQTIDSPEGYVYPTPFGPHASGQTIRAEARSNYAFARFLGWAGSTTNTNAILNFTLTDDTVLLPIFGAELRAVPLGNGTIRGATTSTLVPLRGTIKLDALPNGGFLFVRWGGSASGTNQHLVITNVTTNMIVTALFEALSGESVNVTALADGEGSVSISPTGSQFQRGTAISLLATPNEHQQFLGWSGAILGNENPVSLTANSNMTITARFTTNMVVRSEVNRLTFPQRLRIVVEGATGQPFRIEQSHDLRTWTSDLQVPALEGSLGIDFLISVTNPPTHLRAKRP